MDDFDFTEQDILDAIGELDPYAAAPDGDIPAKVLCSCKDSLAEPLWMLWKESFESGIIPTDLKLQFIAPIYKKGDKSLPANYRPIPKQYTSECQGSLS